MTILDVDNVNSMTDNGCWMRLDVWILDAACCILDAGYWMLDAGYWSWLTSI